MLFFLYYKDKIQQFFFYGTEVFFMPDDQIKWG